MEGVTKAVTMKSVFQKDQADKQIINRIGKMRGQKAKRDTCKSSGVNGNGRQRLGPDL